MQRSKDSGQGNLLGGFDGESGSNDGGPKMSALPPAKPWTETEQLGFEKETLGLYWSGHPVDRYAGALKDFGAKAIGELSEVQSGPRDTGWGPGGPKPIEAETSVGGIVATVRQLKTRKGDRMAVFTLEDSQGSVEVIAFPEAFQRSAGLIETGTLVLVRGKLERDDESIRLLAAEIVPLDSVHERLAREVAIHLKKPAGREMFEALGEIFSRHRGDRRVAFEIDVAGSATPIRVRAEVSSQIRVRPSPALIQEVEQLVGRGTVELR
jgi:DNA polymerase-3 subunit alpha